MDSELFQHIKNIVKPYYEEKHRTFHNWSHITESLTLIKKLNDNSIAIPDAGIVALFFHDIVYDPVSTNNEKNSILLLEKICKGILSDEVIIDASAIILDTKNHSIKHSKHLDYSGYILDIDMASLGLAPDLFFEYRIRAMDEYLLYFTEEEVEKGTLNFINETLKKDIFKTKFFHNEFEEQAKENLSNFKTILSEKFNYESLNNELTVIKKNLNILLKQETLIIKNGEYTPNMFQDLEKDGFYLEIKRSFTFPMLTIITNDPFENKFTLNVKFFKTQNGIKFLLTDDSLKQELTSNVYQNRKLLNQILNKLEEEINMFYLLSQITSNNPNSYEKLINSLLDLSPSFLEKPITPAIKDLFSLNHDIIFSEFKSNTPIKNNNNQKTNSLKK